MAKSLKEALDKEATKKGFTGKERARYIGGTLGNMEKRGKLKIEHKAPPKKPREKLVLTVKKNAAASKDRAYDVYSVYRANGAMFDSGTYRTRKGATSAARSAEAAHNHPNGIHKQGRLRV